MSLELECKCLWNSELVSGSLWWLSNLCSYWAIFSVLFPFSDSICSLNVSPCPIFVILYLVFSLYLFMICTMWSLMLTFNWSWVVWACLCDAQLKKCLFFLTELNVSLYFLLCHVLLIFLAKITLQWPVSVQPKEELHISHFKSKGRSDQD